jgi:CRISPR-associated endonuclease/helicase Cas3
MRSADFAAFYRAVHDGRGPFPWQERLAEQVVGEGKWPDTLSLPTACGKTSAMDVAVFALAAQARLPPGERKAPLRTFFVIDRRLVVDDVTEHAKKLAGAISESDDVILVEVREELGRFGGAVPLAVATLRGGMYRDNTWADRPNQPLVVVSTVDQVGSRLLFRGYGVSDCGRPVHAGLVGNDSLIIVDEAHLSQPFLDTLGHVCGYQAKGWGEDRIAPGLLVVEMSATARGASGAFRLEAADFESGLKGRLDAKKIAELREVGDLERSAAEAAASFASGDAAVVGVVLNTVASARRVFESVNETEDHKVLLTGRVRPYDRDRLLGRFLQCMKVGRNRTNEKRLIVVATQTVEVGADLDFDALVSEAAPLDSLRQRFGRLNRTGFRDSSEAVILKRKRARGKDWIYGEALENSWKWLNEHSMELDRRRVIDFGVRAMQDLFERNGKEELNTKGERGPLMFPAHVEAWAQTNPRPGADPDVAPFLHGAKALDAADVQVVWRADLEGRVAEWAEVLALAPPVSTEALPLPIGLARRWLRQREQPGDAVDFEGTAESEEREEGGAARKFLIWRGPEKSKVGQVGKVQPGDTLVVRSEEGGTDQFGWNPESGPVRDIGDLCANERAHQGSGKFRVRLHPLVVFPSDADKQKREALKTLLEDVARDDDEAMEEARGRIRSEVPKAIFRRNPKVYGKGWLIGISEWPKQRPAVAAGVGPDETEEDDTGSLPGAGVTLRVHTDGVLQRAVDFAGGCGLPDRAAAAVRFAAAMHDYGKYDDRFQMFLDPLRNPAAEPLAKGEAELPVAQLRRRRGMAGYPKGARHEFGSVAIAEKYSKWPEDCDRDLVLYLIGTHHGYGRALAPIWTEDDPEYEIDACVEGERVTVKGVDRVARVDSGWVDRYWRLTRTYGWWGLAYMEAILRRADCVRSREEQGEQNELH